MATRFGVIRFPGSCDEVDAQLACERVGDAKIIWHGDESLCLLYTSDAADE